MEGTPRSVKVRTWLRRSPLPVKIRGETPDGEERVVKMGSGRNKLRDAEKALAECIKLTAIDEDGEITRDLSLHEYFEFEPEERPPAATANSKLESRDLRNLLGEILPQTIERIAESIVKAASEGAKQNADHWQSAFAALADIVKTQGEVTHQQQRLLTDLQMRFHGLVTSLPEGTTPDPTDQMAMKVLAGALGQQNGHNGGGGGMQLTPEMVTQFMAFVKQAQGGEPQ
jgi:hypothetical protein